MKVTKDEEQSASKAFSISFTSCFAIDPLIAEKSNPDFSSFDARSMPLPLAHARAPLCASTFTTADSMIRRAAKLPRARAGPAAHPTRADARPMDIRYSGKDAVFGGRDAGRWQRWGETAAAGP